MKITTEIPLTLQISYENDNLGNGQEFTTINTIKIVYDEEAQQTIGYFSLEIVDDKEEFFLLKNWLDEQINPFNA